MQCFRSGDLDGAEALLDQILAVNPGDAVAQNHLSFLAHGEQNLATGERRSNRVTIGPRVRSQQKAAALLDVLQNLSQHFHPETPT